MAWCFRLVLASDICSLFFSLALDPVRFSFLNRSSFRAGLGGCSISPLLPLWLDPRSCSCEWVAQVKGWVFDFPSRMFPSSPPLLSVLLLTSGCSLKSNAVERFRAAFVLAFGRSFLQAAIQACGRGGQWQRALELLSRLENRPSGATVQVNVSTTWSSCTYE